MNALIYFECYCCVGQRFAMMELKVIFATLLLTFHIKSTQKGSGLDTYPGIILEAADGIWVELKERS